MFNQYLIDTQNQFYKVLVILVKYRLSICLYWLYQLNIGQVDSLKSLETPKITKMTDNFIKVTKHLTKLQENLTIYVSEKYHFIKQ